MAVYENNSLPGIYLYELKTKRLRYLLVLVVFILALGLRLIYVYELEIEAPFRADAGKYCRLAYNLAKQHIYTQDTQPPYTIETSIAPAYPIFLSLITVASRNIPQFYYMTLIIQAILSAATVALSYLLFCRYLTLWASLLGTFLVIISPHLVVYSGYVLTETIFTFFLVLGAYLYTISATKSSIFWGLAAGAIWGLACLTRPALLLFPIFLLGYWVLCKGYVGKTLKIHLAVMVGLLILWTPWQMYIHGKEKKYSPSAVSFALGSYPNLIYKSANLKGYPYREDPKYEEMGESLGAAAKVVWERVKEDPAIYLKWYLVGKPILFWNPNVAVGWGQAFVYQVISTSYHKHKVLRTTYEFMMKYHFIFVILALVLSGIVIIGSAFKKIVTDEFFIITSSGLLLVYFTIIHMILAPLPRYSFPLYPFCYFLSIAALQYGLSVGRSLFKIRNR